MEGTPKETIYINNLNEKVKKEGNKTDLDVSTSFLIWQLMRI